MNVDVEFLSFDEILENGIPEDIGVIINMGDANTSWSGGEYWKNEKLVTLLREWVYNGGGFIGIGEPSAHQYQGHFFQLFDLLGVDREMGYSKSAAKLPFNTCDNHFILKDEVCADEFKNKVNRVFITSTNTDVLLADDENVLMAANSYGKGRAFYCTALDFCDQNVRVLLRALYWAAGKESEFTKWLSENPKTECTAFPEANKLIVLNNSLEAQKTTIYNDSGKAAQIELEPFESKWFNIDNLFK